MRASIPHLLPGRREVSRKCVGHTAFICVIAWPLLLFKAKGRTRNTLIKEHCALIKPTKLQPALPGLLRFGPSRLGRSRNRSSPGSTPLHLGLLNSFALCGHSLCNPGSNVGKSLGAHLPLWAGPFDLRPSCSGGSSNSSTAGSTDLSSSWVLQLRQFHQNRPGVDRVLFAATGSSPGCSAALRSCVGVALIIVGGVWRDWGWRSLAGAGVV